MTKRIDAWDVLAQISNGEEEAAETAAQYLEQQVGSLQGIDESLVGKLEDIDAPIAAHISQSNGKLPNIKQVVERYGARHKEEDHGIYDAVHSMIVGLSEKPKTFYNKMGMTAGWNSILGTSTGQYDPGFDGAQYWFDEIVEWGLVEERKNSGVIPVFDCTDQEIDESVEVLPEQSPTKYSLHPGNGDAYTSKPKGNEL